MILDVRGEHAFSRRTLARCHCWTVRNCLPPGTHTSRHSGTPPVTMDVLRTVNGVVEDRIATALPASATPWIAKADALLANSVGTPEGTALTLIVALVAFILLKTVFGFVFRTFATRPLWAHRTHAHEFQVVALAAKGREIPSCSRA